MVEKIRVFISYSHTDIALVEKLVEIIEGAGMTPLWAKNLPLGTGSGNIGFDEQIKIFIQHAHIFMPILFETSSQWVHQEIGYAKALNIPVLPVTTENINPGGMLQMNNALKMGDNEDEIKAQITIEKCRGLIEKESPIAMYKRAETAEDRAKMMAEYANWLYHQQKFSRVRQKGGLSSFHIPTEPILHKVWKDRYYPGTKSKHHKLLQRNERLELQKHAITSGCRLIVSPSYAIKNRDPLAARTRLNTFLQFLENEEVEEIVIGIIEDREELQFQDDQQNIESLTILGDWFLAESVSFNRGDGFTNTFFTRNAGEISNRIQDFDDEMEYLLSESGWTKENSRRNAIDYLKEKIRTL